MLPIDSPSCWTAHNVHYFNIYIFCFYLFMFRYKFLLFFLRWRCVGAFLFFFFNLPEGTENPLTAIVSHNSSVCFVWSHFKILIIDWTLSDKSINAVQIVKPPPPIQLQLKNKFAQHPISFWVEVKKPPKLLWSKRFLITYFSLLNSFYSVRDEKYNFNTKSFCWCPQTTCLYRDNVRIRIYMNI